MKKKLLKKSGLYLVTDRSALRGKDIISVISKATEAGIDIIQFRDKEASEEEFLEIGERIKTVLKGKKALFIINDRIEMALKLQSDGVHLGQGDTAIEKARKMLGSEKIIGLSTHSIDEMRSAEKKGADYISIGPIFQTPTKPDYKAVGLGLVKKAAAELKIPFVAIGGINSLNIKDVSISGAKRIAVVRAVVSAPDPFTAAKQLLELIR